MSVIAISDLNVSGSNLLIDDESYLNEIDNEALAFSSVHGGSSGPCAIALTVCFSISVLVSQTVKHYNK